MAGGGYLTTAPVRMVIMQPVPVFRQPFVTSASVRKPEDTYEIGKVVGSGSFGVVHRVTDKQHGMDGVLKVMERSTAVNQASPEREVQLQTALAHPNIVRVYESFADPVRVQVVMELCHGGELRDAVDKQPAAGSEAGARYLFKQVMDAVCYMHSQGIAHRDLKLENFLIKERDAVLTECTVKLIDFGFAARFTPGAPVLTTICGSPAYVAPEVFSGYPYGERCDVWSCGIILYYLLSRQLPFAGDSFDDIIQNVTRQPLSFPSQTWRGISKKAREFVDRMCCRDVARRYSAEQALDSMWLQVDEMPVLTTSIHWQGQEDLRLVGAMGGA
mmetsp:Transcript_7617/g.19438  ORF Transcript_7617/g.19438 Transcript_7617/m.19438 type:complete len:330 (-) Transcript_7617:127-1116(-)